MPARAPDPATYVVAGLPKAELHVHHVGSASPATVARLAARHEGTSPVPADPDLLAEYFTFTDFAHFIEVYLSVVDLIRDADDVHMLTTAGAPRPRGAERPVRRADRDAVHLGRRAGSRPRSSAPRSRTRGSPPRPSSASAVRWCFDVPGEAGVPSADTTLDIALRLQPAGLVSFGLGGPEQGVPKSWFAPHFAAARAAGLHSVPHAGESAGPQSVVDALDLLGAERIGHGIAAAQDPA